MVYQIQWILNQILKFLDYFLKNRWKNRLNYLNGKLKKFIIKKEFRDFPDLGDRIYNSIKPLISSTKKMAINTENYKKEIITFDQWQHIEKRIKENYPLILPFMAQIVEIPLEAQKSDLIKRDYQNIKVYFLCLFWKFFVKFNLQVSI